MCLDGSLDPAAVRDKIVVCDRGVNSRAATSDVIRRAGGVEMVLANGAFDGEGLIADCHVLPAIPGVPADVHALLLREG
jgi:hypothetical protein